MKSILTLAILLTSNLALASNNQKLVCNSKNNILIHANIAGYQLTNINVFINGKISKLNYPLIHKDSYDMYLSQYFKPESPYPTYTFLLNDNNRYLLALPGGDMRNDNFTALLFINNNEISLNCETHSI